MADRTSGEFAEIMAEIRRSLAQLWHSGRDQTLENPALCAASCRASIDEAACSISIQLNQLEDLVREHG